MRSRHHCTVHFCEEHGYWECLCDGIPNCHWLDFHEVTYDGAIAAVREHQREVWLQTLSSVTIRQDGYNQVATLPAAQSVRNAENGVVGTPRHFNKPVPAAAQLDQTREQKGNLAWDF